MPWPQHSARRGSLPPDWQRRRRTVLERDGHRCTIRLPGCTSIATEVDHIDRPNDHSLLNLRSACSHCHKKHTAEQAAAARRAAQLTSRRRPEQHPGLITPPARETPRR